MGMFDFFSMMGTHEARKVDNTVIKNCTVDTCSVNDGSQPFETGIQHPEYHDGKWVIVEAYDTKEDAQKGHDKWVKIMSAKKLPAKLVDCCNAEIAQFSNELGSDMEFARKVVKKAKAKK